jgi:hypothetical protein
MQIVTATSTIQEVDHDLVSNFGANDWAEDSQPLGPSLWSREGIVCVFDKTTFIPFQLSRPRPRNEIAIQQVAPTRSVVPGDVFGCYVVMPSFSQAGGGEQDKQQAYPKESLNSRGIIIPLRGLFWNHPETRNEHFRPYLSMVSVRESERPGCIGPT